MTNIITLLEYFNNGGYVMDFSNKSFEDFCLTSIKINVQGLYNLSKYQSLKSFIISDEYPAKLKQKLIRDLFSYEENNLNLNKCNLDEEKIKICRDKLNNAKTAFENYFEELFYNEKSLFAINKIENKDFQVRVQAFQEAIENDLPEIIIGKLKEIVESLFKTILTLKGISYDEKIHFDSLVSKSFKDLDFVPIKNSHNGPILKWFQSLQSLVTSLAEIRNKFGDGHGRDATKVLPISEYPIKLIALSSLPFINFLIEYYDVDNKLKNQSTIDEEEIIWI